jgi:hypothetical protein
LIVQAFLEQGKGGKMLCHCEPPIFERSLPPGRERVPPNRIQLRREAPFGP